jgi:transcriptional regulator with XRE-family HTH domain
VSIGDTLAQARDQAGLTLAQVSRQTRIRESIISSIERGDFSPCGGDFYARGHIRSIASAVGTDPVVLIREYDEEHGPPGAMGAAQIFESASPIRIREPRPLHLGRVLAVAVIAVIGFGAYHYHVFSSHSSNPPATATSRLGHVTTPRPHLTPAPVPPRPVTHIIARPQAVIRLTATEDCWVGLNTASGQSLYQGTIPAGSTMTWREKRTVSMVIGNPVGIVLTVNGKPQQISTVQVVRLSIDPLRKTPVTVG